MAVGGFGSPSPVGVAKKVSSSPAHIYGGSGTSARGVSSTSRFGSSMAERSADSLSLALDQIYKLSEQNTARSEAQAAELRNWQQQQNQIAMDFNAAEAAKNRDWQQMMSNTAHQREVADLQAAGLNPVLSAMGGNGASVTSGATASGVTSSGSQGQVDTGATQALVGLLGTMWSAQTQIEMQRASAENNLAIADKNAEASKLVAEMYTSQAREASQLAAMTGLSQSEISSAATRAAASVAAAAQRYGADSAYAQQVLRSETDKFVNQANVAQSERNSVRTFFGNLVDTGLNFIGGQLSSSRSAQSARDVADIYSETTRRGQDISADVTKRGQNLGLFGDIVKSLGFAYSSIPKTSGKKVLGFLG